MVRKLKAWLSSKDRAQPAYYYYKYTRQCSAKELLKLWYKIFEKYLSERLFLVKLQILKTNSFLSIVPDLCSKFGLSNLFHDFWEDCLRKLKLFLAANRLIYLNISMRIQLNSCNLNPQGDSKFVWITWVFEL